MNKSFRKNVELEKKEIKRGFTFSLKTVEDLENLYSEANRHIKGGKHDILLARLSSVCCEYAAKIELEKEASK